jgi:hypothetical protein
MKQCFLGIFDLKVSLIFKEKFKSTIIRLAVLYETKFQIVKSQEESKLSITERWILRRVGGNTRQDKNKNGNTGEKVG